MSASAASFQSVRVPERGAADVSAEVWKELARSAQFWSLVDRGVVSVEQARHGAARLFGSCYVGRSLVSERVILEVHEKVSGSLGALVAYASGSEFRVERLKSTSTDLGRLMALLAAHFVEATRHYASRGRQFSYVTSSMRGSLVGGRLDLPRTLQLHARGLRHLAAFDKNSVTHDLPVNRLVLAALREVDRMRGVVHLPSEVVARARSMAMVFDDCRGPEVLYGIKSDLAKQAEKISVASGDRPLADLMALAAVVLSNESFEQGAPHRGVAPRAWFLNLETLFEKAVRETMRRALGGQGSVIAGRTAPVPIFTGYPGLSANPDLVVRSMPGPSVCVGDVKYKQWAGTPNAGDMYQLLVHAAAFKASQAFLVFPGASFRVILFGTAATGAAARAYTVDINDLPNDIRAVLEDMSLLNPAAGAAA